MDRNVINLLIEPIKADFHLSDTEVSLVQGFAFGLFLSLAALPIGRLIDTRRRTAVLASGVAFWSLAAVRSEERRVGKEGVSTGGLRWSPEHYKTKKSNKAKEK